MKIALIISVALNVVSGIFIFFIIRSLHHANSLLKAKSSNVAEINQYYQEKELRDKEADKKYQGALNASDKEAVDNITDIINANNERVQNNK